MFVVMDDILSSTYIGVFYYEYFEQFTFAVWNEWIAIYIL